MASEDSIKKIREHLGKVKASALMMSSAQSAIDRDRYLQNMAKELKAIMALLEKIEKS